MDILGERERSERVRERERERERGRESYVPASVNKYIMS